MCDNPAGSSKTLSPPAPSSSGSVNVYLGSELMATRHQTIARNAAIGVHRAILRTPDAHVDRTVVRVAFQVRDALGNVDVLQPGSSNAKR